MAVKENRTDGNVPGRYYVDDQCIDCDICREVCPQCFGRDAEGGMSVVIKQPEGEDEESLCEKALGGCPMGAIGSDGE
jgi:ferredoxin